MLKLDIQFFGGRGASYNDSHGNDIRVGKELDVWSWRHRKNNEPGADQIIKATQEMHDEYGIMGHIESVSVASLGGKDGSNVMAFYSPSENRMVFNTKYADPQTMEEAYKRSEANEFHPKMGNKTGIQATTAHELGHALADQINDNRVATGGSKLEANKEIVINAFRKQFPNKANTYEEITAVPKWLRTISRYAYNHYMKNQGGYGSCNEAIAEAVADVYCNGGRAKKASKYIVEELKRVRKLEGL